MTVTDWRHRNASTACQPTVTGIALTGESKKSVDILCSHCPKQQILDKFNDKFGTNSWSLLCERSCRFQWNHLRHRPLRVVDFLEHQLAGDGRLGTVYFAGATLKRWNHLLHHLVKEDMSELRVEEGTELERDLERGGEAPMLARSRCTVCACRSFLHLSVNPACSFCWSSAVYSQKNPLYRYEGSQGCRGWNARRSPGGWTVWPPNKTPAQEHFYIQILHLNGGWVTLSWSGGLPWRTH